MDEPTIAHATPGRSVGNSADGPTGVDLVAVNHAHSGDGLLVEWWTTY